MCQVVTAPLTLTNHGGVAVNLELFELDWNGPEGLVWGPFEPAQYVVKPFRQNFASTEGIKLPDPPPAAPLAAGAVLLEDLGALGGVGVRTEKPAAALVQHLLKPLVSPDYHGRAVAEANEALLEVLAAHGVQAELGRASCRERV